MSKVKKGDRIQLLDTDDSWADLKPGDKGTVYKVDEEQDLVWVEWDSGLELALIIGVDKFKIVKK